MLNNNFKFDDAKIRALFQLKKQKLFIYDTGKKKKVQLIHNFSCIVDKQTVSGLILDMSETL